MKKKKMNNEDIIKAFHKGSREIEIELHNHPVNYKKVFKNKKKYTRKNKYKHIV